MFFETNHENMKKIIEKIAKEKFLIIFGVQHMSVSTM